VREEEETCRFGFSSNAAFLFYFELILIIAKRHRIIKRFSLFIDPYPFLFFPPFPFFFLFLFFFNQNFPNTQTPYPRIYSAKQLKNYHFNTQAPYSMDVKQLPSLILTCALSFSLQMNKIFPPHFYYKTNFSPSFTCTNISVTIYLSCFLCLSPSSFFLL
jgi:hypothetical protein